MTKPSTSTPSQASAPSQTPESYQDAILPHVSRTFALTIPQLPPVLQLAVGNAYLLCRIADTIEDEPALTAEEKVRYEQALIEVVQGRCEAAPLAAEVASRFSSATLEAERQLFAQLPRVLEVTRRLNPAQQRAIERCLKIMASGMHAFQLNAGIQGLADLKTLDHYCYIVAGVVGDLLSDMFVDFDPAIAARETALRRLSVSFGQGLQITNILKDQWEDRARGACWLPRDIFAKHGVNLATLTPEQAGSGYQAALRELIGITVSHLENALEYTSLIPPAQTGIRRFCLWAIGMAVLTLRNLHACPQFRSGNEVKISRKLVARTIFLSNLGCRYNGVLRWMFRRATAKLPKVALAPEWSAASDIRDYWRESSNHYDLITAQEPPIAKTASHV